MTEDIDEKEAQWKIAELGMTIVKIENGLPALRQTFEGVESSTFMSAQDKWKNLLHPTSKGLKILIRNPPERKTIDQLTGTQINTRKTFWSCSDPECPKIPRHCSECSLCDTLFGDGHPCVCQLCGSSFTGQNHSCPVP